MSEHGADSREIEAKFECDPAGRAALLELTQVGRFRVADRKVQYQDDIYFDTPDFDLVKAGATLRVRWIDGGAVMTFKGDPRQALAANENHIASRVEDEVPLPAGIAAEVGLNRPLPAGIDISPLRRARKLAPPSSLRPIARIENERTVIHLAADDGSQIELDLDHCKATRLRDGRVLEFDEIELETKEADRATLLQVSTALQEMIPGLRPSGETKLGRTMR